MTERLENTQSSPVQYKYTSEISIFIILTGKYTYAKKCLEYPGTPYVIPGTVFFYYSSWVSDVSNYVSLVDVPGIPVKVVLTAKRAIPKSRRFPRLFTPYVL